MLKKAITSKQNDWLLPKSNHPIYNYGHNFSSAYDLYMFLKYSNHTAGQEAIQNPMTSIGEQKVGYKGSGSNYKESKQDIINMHTCLILKIERNPELEKMLLATGNATIIVEEKNVSFGSLLFWGAVKVKGKWKGKNNLGKLWMKIRKELQSCQH